MSKPWIHSISSAKRYGGVSEDYLSIHTLMDMSKGAVGDNRHRILTHQSAFVLEMIQRVIGEIFKRESDGKVMSTRDIAEQHCVEDYHGYIPTATDFLAHLPMKDWMSEGLKGDTNNLVAHETVNWLRWNVLRGSSGVLQLIAQTHIPIMRGFHFSYEFTAKVHEIADVMDYGRRYHGDLRWRALSYHSWFTALVIPKIYPDPIQITTSISISGEEIANLYIISRLGFVPSAQEWMNDMPMIGWMNNGRGAPPLSIQVHHANRVTTTINFAHNEIDTD